MRLTPRQERFVAAYLIDRNAARAARTAGFSPKGAKVTACRLLTNHNLLAALALKEAELARIMDVSKERVIGELLTALEYARTQAAPLAMISACRELGRIMGFYSAEVLEVELRADDKRLMAKFEAMSDAHLIEIIEGERAATKAPLLLSVDDKRPEAKYELMTDAELTAFIEGEEAA